MCHAADAFDRWRPPRRSPQSPQGVFRFLRVGLLALTCVTPLSAHDLARSESRLDVQGRDILCSLTVDLLEFPAVDVDGNGKISYEELDRSIASVFARVKEHFVLRAPDVPTQIVMTRHEMLDEHTLRMELAYTFPATVFHLEVTSTFDQMARRPDHQHFVTAMLSGKRRDAILDGGNRSVTFDDRFGVRTSVSLSVAGLLILAAVFMYQRQTRGRGRR